MNLSLALVSVLVLAGPLAGAQESAQSETVRYVTLSRETLQARGARDCIRQMIARELRANRIATDQAFEPAELHISTNMRAGPPLTESSTGESLWIDYVAHGRIAGLAETVDLHGTTSLRNYRSGVTACHQTGTAGWATFAAYYRKPGAEDGVNVFHGRWAEGDDDEKPKASFQHQFAFVDEAGFRAKIEATRATDRIQAVMLTAKWCVYCPGVELKLRELKAHLGDRLEVSLMDWDGDGKRIAASERFIARSLPGVSFYRDGEVIATLDGGDPNLLPIEWWNEQEQVRAETPMGNLTFAQFAARTAVRDIWIAIVIHNGMHAYHDEQLESLREAQKVLKDELVVYRMDAAPDREGETFYRKHKLFVPRDKDDYEGAVVALLRNGKVVARLQNEYFKSDALTWIRSAGRE